MSDISWMEQETYNLADRIEGLLNKAYKQGVDDAWENVQTLWDKGEVSVAWTADEMMRYAEMEDKHRKDVEKLADEMGIHALYAMVLSMRGE